MNSSWSLYLYRVASREGNRLVKLDQSKINNTCLLLPTVTIFVKKAHLKLRPLGGPLTVRFCLFYKLKRAALHSKRPFRSIQAITSYWPRKDLTAYQLFMKAILTWRLWTWLALVNSSGLPGGKKSRIDTRQKTQNSPPMPSCMTWARVKAVSFTSRDACYFEYSSYAWLKAYLRWLEEVAIPWTYSALLLWFLPRI